MRVLGGCAVAGAMLAGCASSAPPGSASAGVIWDSAAGHAIDADTLVRRAAEADIVILGEAHDNPDHHRLEHWLLEALAARAPVRALVMEQFDVARQAELDAVAVAPAGADRAAQLQTIMGRGWDWPLYQPVVMAAIDRHIALRAANTSRRTLQTVARDGMGALGAGEAERLGLSIPWSAAQQAQLEENIVKGHCGMLPATAAGAVARSQRVRDAVMADTLLSAATPKTGPVLGIFGREHARRDLAIPLYLAARASGMRVLSIGMVEADGETDGQAPAGDVLHGPLGPLHDYLIVTPALQREGDPCAGLVMPAAPLR